MANTYYYARFAGLIIKMNFPLIWVQPQTMHHLSA